MAALRPIPSARTATAAVVNPGVLTSWRSENLRSPIHDSTSVLLLNAAESGSRAAGGQVLPGGTRPVRLSDGIRRPACSADPDAGDQPVAGRFPRIEREAAELAQAVQG